MKSKPLSQEDERQRNLLFRAYSRTLEKYIAEGFAFFGEWHTFDIFTDVIDNYWDEYFSKVYDHRCIATNDFLVEQFTTKRDRNSKMIYEGDILLLGNQPQKKCVVEWDSFRAQFGARILGKEATYMSVGFWENGEIIGNIHDEEYSKYAR